MKRSLFACLLLATVACGGDEPSAVDKLQGKWGEESSSLECVNMFDFDGNTIEVLSLCQLGDGSYAAQSTSGTFVVTGDTFTWQVKASSCPKPALLKETVAFSFVGSQLRLVVPSVAYLLDRADSKAPASSAAVAYGCFDASGTFTASPIRPI